MKKIRFVLDNCDNTILLFCSNDNWIFGHIMEYQENILETELDLAYGYHEYKFYNKDKNVWFCDDKIQMINNNGNINNVVHVKSDNKIKIIHTSDTHGLFQPIPYGDIFIHTGDFSIDGHPGEYEQFNKWLFTLPHQYKIVVLGNHDMDYIYRKTNLNPCTEAKVMLSNAIVLNSELVEILGLKIYGIQWRWFTKQYCKNCDIIDNYYEDWHEIPNELDILLTHCPPYSMLDDNMGSVPLFMEISDKKIKYHLFGHIHQSYGYQYYEWPCFGTTFINSSAVTQDSSKIINKPHIIVLNI